MALRTPIIAAAIAALIAVSCGFGGGDDGGYTEKEEKVRGPEKPANCDPVDSVGQLIYPSTVGDDCVWRGNGKVVAQVGSIVVVEKTGEEDGDETRQLLGYDADDGAITWASEQIKFKGPSDDTKPYEVPSDEQTRLLYDGKDSYVALFTTTVVPASAVAAETKELSIRTYKVDAKGKVVGKRFNAPDGFNADSGEDERYGTGKMLLKKSVDDYGYENDYEVFDPAERKTTRVAMQGELPPASGIDGASFASEVAFWATSDGGLITTYDIGGVEPIGGRGVAVRGTDGAVLWASHNRPVAGADPTQAQVAGLFGDYIAILWRVGTYTGDIASYNERPGIVALHHIGSGDVVASQQLAYDQFPSAPANVAASPNGALLAVDDTVFNVKDNSIHAQVLNQLQVTTLTDDGIGYGTGNADHRMAVNVKTNDLLWDNERGEIPVASGKKTVIFSLGDDKTVIAFPTKKP